MDSPMILGWLWITVGLIALIAEIVLPSFFMIFVTAAVPLPAILAFLGFDPLWQLTCFGVTLGVLLLVVRPFYGKHTQKDRRDLPSRADVLVGKIGMVSVTIDPATGGGRVLIEGEDWAAQSTGYIAQNSRIKVVGSDGIVLNVESLGR